MTKQSSKRPTNLVKPPAPPQPPSLVVPPPQPSFLELRADYIKYNLFLCFKAQLAQAVVTNSDRPLTPEEIASGVDELARVLDPNFNRS